MLRATSRLLTGKHLSSRYFAVRSLSTETPKNVRIGCFSGFWGDSCTFATDQLVNGGNIDFLVGDYLAEVTMSLLAAMKAKNPSLGFCPDFFEHLAPVAPKLVKKQIKVVVNAGGLNPAGCAAKLDELIKMYKLPLKVAAVTGDDLISRADEVSKFSSSPDTKFNTLNCYLGAEPIAKALDEGADIVITGRCVDSALVLGPLLHKFKWSMDDFDKLAQGSLAGHLVECGAQCSGGNFTDWELVENYANAGFPIADVKEDGTFRITKPENTGGLVSFGTVAEQMLYEIADPACYALPDVNCDFTQVKITEVGPSEVEVVGARGVAPSSNYKVSATFVDGYKATTLAPMIGPKAAQKGYKNAMAIVDRCNTIFERLKLGKFEEVRVECLGGGSNYGVHPMDSDTKECALWISVRHQKKEALVIFGKEIAGSSTAMAPGTTVLLGGRPKPTPILRFRPFMFPKELVDISVNGEQTALTNICSLQDPPVSSRVEPQEEHIPDGNTIPYSLGQFAYLRSGDKGNSANLGIICRDPSVYDMLDSQITEAAVQDYLQFLGPDLKVSKYRMPGVSAFNFVLENALGGGGVASLRSDPQGKAIGQIFSDFVIMGEPKKCDLLF